GSTIDWGLTTFRDQAAVFTGDRMWVAEVDSTPTLHLTQMEHLTTPFAPVFLRHSSRGAPDPGGSMACWTLAATQDPANEASIGFVGASPLHYYTAYLTGHRVSSDPAGTLRAPKAIASGVANPFGVYPNIRLDYCVAGLGVDSTAWSVQPFAGGAA